MTILVQPIYLPEFNEAYQSTWPDGKINQYKLQHFKRTEQQHNFFRVPFSFAEKILIHRDKIYSFCLVTLSMCHFSLTFLQCVFKCLLIITCQRRGKVTFAAFIWLFSTVRFQMCPQIACLRRGKVTLVAFVWFFSSVCFQMIPQIACIIKGILKLPVLEEA